MLVLTKFVFAGGEGGTGGETKPHCINGADIALTPTGPKRIDQLVIGDQVAVGKVENGDYTYAPIITFLYRSSKNGPGIRFSTSSGRNLTLSNEHLVFLAPRRNAVMAKNVRVGDSFYFFGEGSNSELDEVVSVEKTFMEGRYSPVTKSGVILVNQMLVSCYSNVEDHHLMHYAVHWLLPFVKSDSMFGTEGAVGGGDGLHAIGRSLWQFFRFCFFATS